MLRPLNIALQEEILHLHEQILHHEQILYSIPGTVLIIMRMVSYSYVAVYYVLFVMLCLVSVLCVL